MLKAFFLSLLIFSIYCLGVSKSVYGGDSGDVILAAWFGGVAHPPGYPLNTMIGWLFTHLPFESTVAYKANLMAAFFIALTGGFLFLTTEKLTKNTTVGIVTSLIFVFNPLIWLYAHVIEVFQLNLLLVAISLYFLITWSESLKSKKEKINELYLSSFFLGLAVFHHQTSVLLIPAYFYIYLKIRKDKKATIILKLFLIFLLGILPYIFVPFAAMRQTPINWGNVNSIESFLRLLTRADYGTFQASNFIYGDSALRRIIQLGNFILFSKSDFNLIGSALVLVGMAYSFFKARTYFWFIFWALLFVGPFFFFYGSFPINNDFYLALWERFILLSYLFLTLFASYGLLIVHKELLKVFSKKNFITSLSLSFKTFLVSFLLFMIPLFFFARNFEKANLSNFEAGDWLAHDTLNSAGYDSVIFLLGDTSVFNTQYIYYSHPEYRSKKIIKMGSLHFLAYRKHLVEYYPEMNYPDGFLSEDESDGIPYLILLINANKDRFGIYSADVIPQIQDYRWIQVGLLKKMVANKDFDKNSIMSLNEPVYAGFRFQNQQYPYSHFMFMHIKEIYYDSLVNLGRDLSGNGLDQEAKQYLTKAIEMFPDNELAYMNLAIAELKLGHCDAARNALITAEKINNKNRNVYRAMGDVYKDCYKDEEKAAKYFDLFYRSDSKNVYF